ncbi:hypothetical protein [uncultured Tateyamaria sp.]|uniref:hypothetical protein n=1 Tax=uncultured Tateyamaria sp. TaxID=455651 RepID=UPI00261121DA|nr:hypothetical protein [uncultured Tateyamaria sp.]
MQKSDRPEPEGRRNTLFDLIDHQAPPKVHLVIGRKLFFATLGAGAFALRLIIG